MVLAETVEIFLLKVFSLLLNIDISFNHLFDEMFAVLEICADYLFVSQNIFLGIKMAFKF